MSVFHCTFLLRISDRGHRTSKTYIRRFRPSTCDMGQDYDHLMWPSTMYIRLVLVLGGMKLAFRLAQISFKNWFTTCTFNSKFINILHVERTWDTRQFPLHSRAWQVLMSYLIRRNTNTSVWDCLRLMMGELSVLRQTDSFLFLCLSWFQIDLQMSITEAQRRRLFSPNIFRQILLPAGPWNRRSFSFSSRINSLGSCVEKMFRTPRCFFPAFSSETKSQ